MKSEFPRSVDWASVFWESSSGDFNVQPNSEKSSVFEKVLYKEN